MQYFYFKNRKRFVFLFYFCRKANYKLGMTTKLFMRQNTYRTFTINNNKNKLKAEYRTKKKIKLEN